MDNLTEDGREIIGTDVVTRTYSELLDNGYWKVTQSVIQKRLVKDEEEWEKRELKMSAEAEELRTAILNAFVSVQTYLELRDNDLFNKPKKPTSGEAIQVVPSKTEDGEYIN